MKQYQLIEVGRLAGQRIFVIEKRGLVEHQRNANYWVNASLECVAVMYQQPSGYKILDLHGNELTTAEWFNQVDGLMDLITSHNPA